MVTFSRGVERNRSKANLFHFAIWPFETGHKRSVIIL